MKRLLLFLLWFVLSYPTQSQANTLPRPSGKHSIGVTYLGFTDDSRKELFDNSLQNNREITVKVWYPTENSSKPEPYFLNAKFAIDSLQFPEIFKDLKTNSSRDLPVSPKEKDYPVLIFSHGWGEHYSQNSILMEELASHGYIIFSIAHHYECKFSSYPNGRTIHLDVNSIRFQKIMQEQQNPKAIELFHKMFSASNDKERMQVFVDTNNTLPTLLKESPKYWAEDISFFLNQVKDINRENEIFKGKLSLDKIGVFGMSMGGIASSEICITDRRIKAGISVDGGLFGSVSDKKIQMPFMFLNSKRFLGYGNLFTSKSTTDCYSLSVKNSDHYNFTDYSIYPVPFATPLMGTIDGNKMIEIMNVTILAFFDKYLKEKEDIDLVRKAKEYSEIEVVTNIDGIKN
ncbi:MAG: alpha/beta hydrolase family protein [Phycisphaerae bacterium]